MQAEYERKLKKDRELDAREESLKEAYDAIANDNLHQTM